MSALNTRILNATPAQVFQAWADAKLLTQGWGPNGYTSTFHKFDFESGGKWSFILHGPNGTDYQNEIEFVEVKQPGGIVLQHVSKSRIPGHSDL